LTCPQLSRTQAQGNSVLYKRYAWQTLRPPSQALGVLQSFPPAATVIQRLPLRTQHAPLPKPALVADVLNRAATAIPQLRILTASVQSETCALTASARPPFLLVVTVILRLLLKTRLAPPPKPASSVAVFNRDVIVTRLQIIQIACALLETSVSIASASLPFPPAVIVTQKLPTPTLSVPTASFVSDASAKLAHSPPKAGWVRPATAPSTPRSSSSSTPPSPSSQTRTPSST